jgi:O-antigen/teichoic acid export membrane protein
LQYIINAYFLHIEKGWISQFGLLIINVIFIGFLFINNSNYSVKNAATLLYIYFSLYFLISLLSLLFISHINFEKRIILPSKQILKLLLKFSRYPYITNAVFFLGANVDLIAVKIYYNSDLSTYVQSVKIFQIFCSTVFLLYYPFMGKIIEKKYKEGVQYLAQSSRIISLILFLAIIPFLFLCYFFLDRFFPDNYSRIMMLLGYFSISFFSVSLAYFYTSYFVASKMSRQNLISAVIFFTSITASSFLLVPFLGIKGGAIAYGISMLLSLAFDISCFLKINKLKLTDIFFVKKVDIILIRNNLKFLK